MPTRKNTGKTTDLLDWAESRLGQRWTLHIKEHIDGPVIIAKGTNFTPSGLRVIVGERFPYFSLNLGERTIDATKFNFLQARIYSSKKGNLVIYTHSPNGELINTIKQIKEDIWHNLGLAMCEISWYKGISGNQGNASWGGVEGIIDALSFRLEFPPDSIVKIDGVSLLGNGIIDTEPPQILPLEDSDGCVHFAITDSSGIRKSSLLLAVKNLVFNINSHSLDWDEKILTWKPRYFDDKILKLYVEVADREGNKRSLEIERFPPGLTRSKDSRKIGFVRQRHTHQVKMTRGKLLHYQVDVEGKHDPINRTIIIEGCVEDPKILIKDGLDFETPKTLTRTLIRPNMTEREKAMRIWRITFEAFNGSGPGSTVNRTQFFNVYGYGYCSERALTQGAIYEAAGLCWMFIQYSRSGGHSVVQVFYEGGWHLLDAHLRQYCVLGESGNIAGAEQIEGNNMVICGGNVKISNSFKKRFWNPWLICKDVMRSPGLQSGSMSMYLRKFERLVRTWQGQGRWAHCTNEPLDYANGQLLFEPRLTNEGLKEESEASVNISICRDGFPQCIYPTRIKKRSYVIYKVNSPYLIVGGRVFIEGCLSDTGNQMEIAISTNNGKSWNSIWQAKSYGKISEQVDFLPWMSRRRVEADSPCFRDVYEFLVRIELVKLKSRTEVSIRKIRIVTDLQMHPKALPSLQLGINKCSFSCKSRSENVVITHIWDEMGVVTASSSTPIEGENISLTAKIANNDLIASGPFKVLFFDGHPDIDGIPIGKPLSIKSIPAKKTVSVQALWKASPRIHRPLHQPVAGNKGYVHSDIYIFLEFLDPIILAQGYTKLASLRLKIAAKPKMGFTNQCINWNPRKPHHGDNIRVLAIVWNNSSRDTKFIYVHGTPIKGVRVRFYVNDPDKEGKLIGEYTIPRIEPLEHGLADIKWRVPYDRNKIRLYVEVAHNTGPLSSHQKIKTSKIMHISQ